MKTFLVWLEGGKSRVRRMEYPGDKFLINGTIYTLSNQDFSDFDQLRNREGKLIGFYFIVDGSAPIFKTPFFQVSPHIICKNGELKISFSDEASSIETVQGIGTLVYEADGAIALCIPDWNRGEIGFHFDQKAEVLKV